MAMNQMFQWMRQVSGKLGGPLDQTNPQHMSFYRQLQKDLKAEQPLTKSLNELDITVLDLETSGFYPDGGDKILSIGAVKIREGRVNKEETYYSPVCEPDALSEEVASLTGLTKEELKGAPELSDVLKEFYEFIQTDLLVAHHARHEKKFLQHASYQAIGVQFQHRLLDTSFLLRIAAPDLPVSNLDDCCGYYSIPIKHRHHALGDALVTADLWAKTQQEVIKRGFETLQDIYAYLNSQNK
ncbi:exonuclease domain-containing protein [Alteribacillus sp. HJP-4]|uniref:exonuclease domain-containing protein n=1 Tax=Alteribacillus sp. HJP-4 TaxID=2775394 RepID=UPI0035CD0D61